MTEVKLTLMGLSRLSPKLGTIHAQGYGVHCSQGLRNHVRLLHLPVISKLLCMWFNSEQLPGLTTAVQIQGLCASGTCTTDHEFNVQVKLAPGMPFFSLFSQEAGPWRSQSPCAVHTESLQKSGNLSSGQHARVHPQVCPS